MLKNIINKIKKNKEIKKYKEKLIEDFLAEYGDYIPKYSPKGLKLDWHIFVYEDGEHDILTGEFLGEYKVGISQNPPKFLYKDSTCYEYNIKTKQLIKTGCRWT